MSLSRANKHWTVTFWLFFQRHRQGEIGDLARFVEKDPLWPVWPERKVFEAYLQEHNAALLPHFLEAGQEYERAIIEGREY